MIFNIDNMIINLFKGSEVEDWIPLADVSDCEVNVKGERNPRAKLTESDVLEILDMLDAGARTCDVAEIFNVSPGHISNIKAGRYWAHLRERSPEKLDSEDSGELTPITINLNIWLPKGVI